MRVSCDLFMVDKRKQPWSGTHLHERCCRAEWLIAVPQSIRMDNSDSGPITNLVSGCTLDRLNFPLPLPSGVELPSSGNRKPNGITNVKLMGVGRPIIVQLLTVACLSYIQFHNILKAVKLGSQKRRIGACVESTVGWQARDARCSPKHKFKWVILVERCTAVLYANSISGRYGSQSVSLRT